MIVIATHGSDTGSNDFLPNLLISLNNVDLCGQKVLVVDTGSKNKLFLQKLPSLNLNFEYEVCETPYRGYDSGAYIYAYKNFPDEYYFFLQDSLKIKHPDFIKDTLDKVKSGKVVPLITFPTDWFDNQEQKSWLTGHLGSSYYEKGIFGPIFSVSRENMDRIPSEKLLIPSNKAQQMGMERGWSIIFHGLGIPIEPLEKIPFGRFQRDEYKYFQKFFPVRK